MLPHSLRFLVTLSNEKNQSVKTLGQICSGSSLWIVLMFDYRTPCSGAVMLFDEMSLSLSTIVINELYRVLREIRARGITVILVEQNVRRSLKETDRAYIRGS